MFSSIEKTLKTQTTQHTNIALQTVEEDINEFRDLRYNEKTQPQYKILEEEYKHIINFQKKIEEETNLNL